MSRKRALSDSLLRSHSRGSFERLLFEAEDCNGPVSSNEHPVLYRLVQAFVFVSRLVTPFSYVYLLWSWLLPGDPAAFPGGSAVYWVLLGWMAAEALFFPYYYYLFTQMNALNEELAHFASDPPSRKRLMENCFTALRLAAEGSGRAPEEYIREVVAGWFLDQPLGKVCFGNAAAWTAWAFFGKDVKYMTTDEIQENNSIVRYMAEQACWTFPPGFATDIPALRLNLDPVFATQRPLLFYFVTSGIHIGTHAALWLLGFRLCTQPGVRPASGSQNIYHRPASRPNPSKLPIVFIHGIGIGLGLYLVLIYLFPTDVDVFLVEWPYVAMQMATRGPTVEEAVSSVVAVLKCYQHPKACFVAHSLGTTLVSWMLHDPIGATVVTSSVLLDPVVFLLCDPKVASVFVYKNPSGVVDLLMHFFLSRELFISNALSRYFAWSHNILFVEDLLNNHACCRAHAHVVLTPTMHTEGSLPSFVDSKHYCKHKCIEHSIVLSTEDSIVPVPPVLRYLANKREQGFKSFEVIRLDGQMHGEMLFRPSGVKLILQKIQERCVVEEVQESE